MQEGHAGKIAWHDLPLKRRSRSPHFLARGHWRPGFALPARLQAPIKLMRTTRLAAFPLWMFAAPGLLQLDESDLTRPATLDGALSSPASRPK